MAFLQWTTPGDWEALHGITIRNMPLFSDMTFSEFVAVHFFRQGWTILQGQKIIGAISFSDYAPGLAAAVHCIVDRRYRFQWANPEMISPIREFVRALQVKEVIGITIVGHTEYLGRTLEKMGFRFDGVWPRAYGRNGQFYDLKIYKLPIAPA